MPRNKVSAKQLKEWVDAGKVDPTLASSIPKKLAKYRNTITYIGELRFDSRKEAERWHELTVLQEAGMVANLQRQVAFPLRVGSFIIGKIVLDFVYERRTPDGWEIIHEDVKGKWAGALTPLFRWKRKHFEFQYDRTIIIT